MCLNPNCPSETRYFKIDKKKKTTTSGGKEGEIKEGKKGGNWDFTNLEAWIKAILSTAILLFLIVSNPLLAGLQNALTNLLPDGVDAGWPIWSLVGAGLFFYFLYVIRSNSIWLGIALIMVLTILTMVWPMLAATPQFAAMICTFVNPANVEKCMSSSGGDVPAAAQVEPTAVASVRFDTSSYGMTVFGDQSSLNLNLYAMPLQVINPSDTKIVKDFYVQTAVLWNSTILSNRNTGKQPLGVLIPDRCAQTAPCTIGPGDSITVNLRGSGYVEYDKDASDQAEVRVTYSYEYVGEGHNDLIFAANWTDYQKAKSLSVGAQKFGGPVGVVVYFVPNTVVVMDTGSYTGGAVAAAAGQGAYTGDAYVQVALTNDDESAYALLQSPMNITMLFQGGSPFTEEKSCAFSWSATPVKPTPWDTPTNTYENDKLQLCSDTSDSTDAPDTTCGGGITLYKKQMVACDYPYDLTSNYQEYLDHPKTITFIARIDYHFMQSIVKRGITIQRSDLPGSTTTTLPAGGETSTTTSTSSTSTTSTTTTTLAQGPV